MAGPSAPAAADTEGQKKRKRVSRACDQCFFKKDKCDGTHPVCMICQRADRPCTYERPEKKRGPSQGVRQRLEEQIEMLESVLGFVLTTAPSVSVDVLRRLQLEERQAIIAAKSSASPAGDAVSNGSPAAMISIYPGRTRDEVRDEWRRSDLAMIIGPFLGLKTGEDAATATEEPDESSVRDRVHKALTWREKVLRYGASQHASGSQSGHDAFASPGLDASHAAAMPSREGSSHLWSPRNAGGLQAPSPSVSSFAAVTSAAQSSAGFNAQSGFSPFDNNSPGSMASYSFSDARGHAGAGPAPFAAQSPRRVWEHSGEAHNNSRLRDLSVASERRSAPLSDSAVSTQMPPPSRIAGSSTYTSRQPLDVQQRSAVNATINGAGAAAEPALLPLELEEEMDNLLHSYFNSFHPLYPFVDRTALLSWNSAVVMRGGQHLSAGGTGIKDAAEGESVPHGRTALVLSICALAAAGYTDTLGTSSAAESADRLLALSDVCHTRARGLFFTTNTDSVMARGASHTSPGGRADGAGDIESVQAMIILAFADIQRDNLLRAWIGVGMAVRLSQELGIDRCDSNSKSQALREQSSSRAGSAASTPAAQHAATSDDTEMKAASPAGGRATQPAMSARRVGELEQMRRLTFYTLFCLDTFLSASLGRSSALRRADFSALLPKVEDDDMTECEIVEAQVPPAVRGGRKPAPRRMRARVLSTFVAQIELAMIVNDIVAGISLPGGLLGAAAASVATGKINDVAARLHKWRTSLPPHLVGVVASMPSPTSLAAPQPPTQAQPCHAYHLALLTHFAFILVDRAAQCVARHDWSRVAATSRPPPVHLPVSGLDSLWSAFSSRSGDGSGPRVPGRSDWKRVTIASPTSDGALPRLLDRFCECFGPSRLPPFAAYFALAAAHSLPSPAADGDQESWELLHQVAHSSAAKWNMGIARVSRVLPALRRDASRGSVRVQDSPGRLQAPAQQQAPISASSSSREPVSPHTRHDPSLQPFDGSWANFGQGTFDLTASFDHLQDAHALAYALGISQSSAEPASNGQELSASHVADMDMRDWGAHDASLSSQTPISDSASISEWFETGLTTNEDQSGLLFHLGLRQPQSVSAASGDVFSDFSLGEPANGVLAQANAFGRAPSISTQHNLLDHPIQGYDARSAGLQPPLPAVDESGAAGVPLQPQPRQHGDLIDHYVSRGQA